MPGGMAPLVAGWKQQFGSWPAGPTLAGQPPTLPFPQTPLDLVVQIRVDASWIDITPFVYQRDGHLNVEIARGRANEAARIDPSTASFQLNNRGGQFSP